MNSDTQRRRPTLSDVAARLGVSVTTVSLALSGKGRVAEATRLRILQAVEELAYQPDEAARKLANRREEDLAPHSVRKATCKRKTHMPTQVLFDVLDIRELKDIVALEIQQRHEEGFQVEPFRQTLQSREQWTRGQLLSLYAELCTAPSRDGYDYEEPASLDCIRACRVAGPRSASVVLTPAKLYDRVHGGWLGRCVGCLLGKPIEAGWPRGKVRDYLTLAGAYPLDDYIPRLVPVPAVYDMNAEAGGCFRGEIDGALYDDDLDYTILGLHILETHGIDFATRDVGTAWLNSLPYYRVYTAERVTYRNLMLNTLPPEAATTLNPAREWVGARIRADIYGLVAPGKPELAAAMAYRDAALSHAKNGVYSAMFVAAMLAWAYVTGDVREVVEVGLSEIPERSRLAEGIRSALALHREGHDWESAYERLLLNNGSYHPVHAINNTLWVVLGLLYSDGDFGRAICTAVMCGLDTDCNGANAGALLGVQHGAGDIPARWTDPLRDTLYTTVARWRERRISELARRTARLATQILTTR